MKYKAEVALAYKRQVIAPGELLPGGVPQSAVSNLLKRKHISEVGGKVGRPPKTEEGKSEDKKDKIEE